MFKCVLALCLVSAVANGCADPEVSTARADLAGTTDNEGSVDRDVWRWYGPFDVAEGGSLAAVLKVKSGDADLYVRVGEAPTTDAWDCRPYAAGNKTEGCDVAGPASVYVAVVGYSWFSEFGLRVTVAGEPEPDPDTCGNSTLDPGESCDGKPIECSELDPTWRWGEAPCRDDCSGWDESVCNPAHPQQFSDWGTVAARQWRHFGPFNTSGGTLTAAMGQSDLGGTGDADLYVRRGAPPTEDDFDCRSFGPTSVESCTVEGAGLYYVSARGYAASSDYTIDVDYEFKYTTPEVRVNERAGNVDAGEWVYFGPYPHGAGLVQVVMSGTYDADLYLRHGGKPTETSWDCRPYLSGSDEFCDLGEVDAGELWVGVRGYAPTSYFETMSVWLMQ